MGECVCGVDGAWYDGNELWVTLFLEKVLVFEHDAKS